MGRCRTRVEGGAPKDQPTRIMKRCERRKERSMSPQPHEVPRMPHDRQAVIDNKCVAAPDIMATLQVVTGYSAEDLWQVGGYNRTIVDHFPETIIHDARDELPCALDSEGVLVMPEIVVETAKIISVEPMILADYPL